jgi:hypothetical protein
MGYCNYLDQMRMENCMTEFLEKNGFCTPDPYEELEEQCFGSYEAYLDELADRATADLDKTAVVKAKIARVAGNTQPRRVFRVIDDELMTAVCQRSWKEVKYLLARGANPNYNDGYRSSVLSSAVFGRRGDIVKHLIDHGADVNQRNDNGTTPLMVAGFVSRDQLQLIAFLLNRGADINAVDRDGRTILMRAIRFGFNDQAVFLIQRGADTTVKDRYGKTALDILNGVGGEVVRDLRKLLKRRGLTVVQ